MNSFFFVAVYAVGVSCQLSKPIASDSQHMHNKYAVEADDVVFGTNVEHRTNDTADFGLGISWANGGRLERGVRDADHCRHVTNT